MKLMLSVIALAMTFASASAFAFEGSLRTNADGSITLTPVQGDCGEPQPVGWNRENCDSNGRACPMGYHLSKRYCWQGWKLVRCGSICIETNYGAAKPGGDRDSRH